jgi:hypothetical protein
LQNNPPEDPQGLLWLDQEIPLIPEEQWLLDETTEEPLLPITDPIPTKQQRKPFPNEPAWSPANVLAGDRSVKQLRKQARELRRAVDAGKTSLDGGKAQELQKRRELYLPRKRILCLLLWGLMRVVLRMGIELSLEGPSG